jgi:hypothetical protein
VPAGVVAALAAMLKQQHENALAQQQQHGGAHSAVQSLLTRMLEQHRSQAAPQPGAGATDIAPSLAPADARTLVESLLRSQQAAAAPAAPPPQSPGDVTASWLVQAQAQAAQANAAASQRHAAALASLLQQAAGAFNAQAASQAAARAAAERERAAAQQQQQAQAGPSAGMVGIIAALTNAARAHAQQQQPPPPPPPPPAGNPNAAAYELLSNYVRELAARGALTPQQQAAPLGGMFLGDGAPPPYGFPYAPAGHVMGPAGAGQARAHRYTESDMDYLRRADPMRYADILKKRMARAKGPAPGGGRGGGRGSSSAATLASLAEVADRAAFGAPGRMPYDDRARGYAAPQPQPQRRRRAARVLSSTAWRAPAADEAPIRILSVVAKQPAGSEWRSYVPPPPPSGKQRRKGSAPKRAPGAAPWLERDAPLPLPQPAPPPQPQPQSRRRLPGPPVGDDAVCAASLGRRVLLRTGAQRQWVGGIVVAADVTMARLRVLLDNNAREDVSAAGGGLCWEVSPGPTAPQGAPSERVAPLHLPPVSLAPPPRAPVFFPAALAPPTGAAPPLLQDVPPPPPLRLSPKERPVPLALAPKPKPAHVVPPAPRPQAQAAFAPRPGGDISAGRGGARPKNRTRSDLSLKVCVALALAAAAPHPLPVEGPGSLLERVRALRRDATPALSLLATLSLCVRLRHDVARVSRTHYAPRLPKTPRDAQLARATEAALLADATLGLDAARRAAVAALGTGFAPPQGTASDDDPMAVDGGDIGDADDDDVAGEPDDAAAPPVEEESSGDEAKESKEHIGDDVVFMAPSPPRRGPGRPPGPGRGRGRGPGRPPLGGRGRSGRGRSGSPQPGGRGRMGRPPGSGRGRGRMAPRALSRSRSRSASGEESEEEDAKRRREDDGGDDVAAPPAKRRGVSNEVRGLGLAATDIEAVAAGARTLRSGGAGGGEPEGPAAVAKRRAAAAQAAAPAPSGRGGSGGAGSNPDGGGNAERLARRTGSIGDLTFRLPTGVSLSALPGSGFVPTHRRWRGLPEEELRALSRCAALRAFLVVGAPGQQARPQRGAAQQQREARRALLAPFRQPR